MIENCVLHFVTLQKSINAHSKERERAFMAGEFRPIASDSKIRHNLDSSLLMKLLGFSRRKLVF